MLRIVNLGIQFSFKCSQSNSTLIHRVLFMHELLSLDLSSRTHTHLTGLKKRKHGLIHTLGPGTELKPIDLKVTLLHLSALYSFFHFTSCKSVDVFKFFFTNLFITLTIGTYDLAKHPCVTN